MKITPESLPYITPNEIHQILAHRKVNSPVAIVGLRGFVSMGKPGNDRGLYDDAIFLVNFADGPPMGYHIFRFTANTDPGAYRKGIATLKEGTWQYRIGIHGLSKPKKQQYTALVQADAVTVRRDGEDDETGWFGINIHRGGRRNVSSLGCQTIDPSQWSTFIRKTQAFMRQHNIRTVPYVLMLESDRQKHLVRSADGE